MSDQQKVLQRPILIKFIAFLFVLAPLGNILISYFVHQSANSNPTESFFNLLEQIPLFDWIWLSLIFISGLLLLIQHKTAWALAVATLVLTLGMNLYSALQIGVGATDTGMIKVQILLSILITFTVLVVIFYARYPYLDRRQGWIFPATRRVKIKTSITVMAQDIFEGVTESISTRGCLIRLQKDLGPVAKMNFVDVILPEVRNLKIKGRVVGYQDNLLRLKFKDLRLNDKQILIDWLEKQS